MTSPIRRARARFEALRRAQCRRWTWKSRKPPCGALAMRERMLRLHLDSLRTPPRVPDEEFVNALARRRAR